MIRSLTAMALGAFVLIAPAHAQTADDIPASISQGQVFIRDRCILSNTGEIGSEAATPGALGSVLLAVGDAIIPTVTGFIFDQIMASARAALRAKSSSTTAISQGLENETFWTYNGTDLRRRFGCIIFVRPAHSRTAIDPDFQAQLDSLNPGWRDLLNREPLSLTGAPEMIAEFRVEPVRAYVAGDSRTQRIVGFRLRPVTLAFGATGARRTSSARAKDVTFAVSVTALTADGSALSMAPIYAHDFVFSDLPIGSVRTYTGANSSMGSDAGPPVSVPEARFNFNNEDLVSPVPLTVTITEVETEAEGDLQRAILDAIEAKKSEITSPLDERLRSLIRDEVTPEEDDN